MDPDRQELVHDLANDAFSVLMEMINLFEHGDDIKCEVVRKLIRLMWERLLTPTFRQ